MHELLGAGVYCGSAPRKAAYHRDGHVFVVGGANSAGQTARYLAEFAAIVLKRRLSDVVYAALQLDITSNLTLGP